MKIQDVGGRKLAACCAFNYRGYVVSCSTIFTPSSCAVFGPDGNPVTAQDFPTVAAALDWIHARDADKLREALRACITEPGARCMRAPSVAGFVRRLSNISKLAADALR